jgi:predicted nucleic acid-binding protein
VTATLLDSNVLIDSFDRESPWRPWADYELKAAVDRGPVFVNQIVFAEVSVGFPTAEACESALSERWLELVPIPWPAAFAAGRAFLAYRRRGGLRRSPLPDFFIGAHAAVARLPLLTRDPARYRSYFPGVRLITPD